jgi:hypothetical protein
LDDIYRTAFTPVDIPTSSVDSPFSDVVIGLNSATAKLVQRAHDRLNARRAGRSDYDSSPPPHEGKERHIIEHSALLPRSEVCSSTSISDAAAEDNLIANKAIVERLASIEIMLSKLAAASERSSGNQALQHSQQSVQPASGVDFPSPRLSVSSQPSVTDFIPSHMSLAQDSGNSVLNAMQMFSQTAASAVSSERIISSTDAADAASKYLKTASSAAQASSISPPFPFTFPATAPEQRSVASIDDDSNSAAEQLARGSDAAPVNRQSLEKAMRAIAGSFSPVKCFPAEFPSFLMRIAKVSATRLTSPARQLRLLMHF